MRWGQVELLVLLAAGCIRFPPDLRYKIGVVPEEALLQEAAYYFDPEDCAPTGAANTHASFTFSVVHEISPVSPEPVADGQ